MIKKKIDFKKIILSFIVLIFLLSFVNQNIVFANTEPTSARAMVVIDGTNNKVLYSNDMNERLPMASTTKIVTAIVAIENCDDLYSKFVISNNAVGIEEQVFI